MRFYDFNLFTAKALSSSLSSISPYYVFVNLPDIITEELMENPSYIELADTFLKAEVDMCV